MARGGSLTQARDTGLNPPDGRLWWIAGCQPTPHPCGHGGGYNYGGYGGYGYYGYGVAYPIIIETTVWGGATYYEEVTEEVVEVRERRRRHYRPPPPRRPRPPPRPPAGERG